MKKMRQRIVIGLLLAIAAGPGFAQAQRPRPAAGGGIVVTVEDATGARVAKATIALRDGEGHVIAHGISNAEGSWRHSRIVPGEYSLSIHFYGFKPFLRAAKIEAGRNEVITATLTVQSHAGMLGECD